jgi:hypothetical protein
MQYMQSTKNYSTSADKLEIIVFKQNSVCMLQSRIRVGTMPSLRAAKKNRSFIRSISSPPYPGKKIKPHSATLHPTHTLTRKKRENTYVRRLSFDLSLHDALIVCAERSPVGLLITLDHRLPLLIRRTRVELLEKLVDLAVAAGVGAFRVKTLLLFLDDLFLERAPVNLGPSRRRIRRSAATGRSRCTCSTRQRRSSDYTRSGEIYINTCS